MLGDDLYCRRCCAWVDITQASTCPGCLKFDCLAESEGEPATENAGEDNYP
jgi:hypothetical protein